MKRTQLARSEPDRPSEPSAEQRRLGHRRRPPIRRGDRRITLQAPRLTPRPDAHGARVAKAPRRLRTWATYHPLRGAEGPDGAGLEAGRLYSRWIVRAAGLAEVTTAWTLHHAGRGHGIAAIVPSTLGRGQSHLEIITETLDVQAAA